MKLAPGNSRSAPHLIRYPVRFPENRRLLHDCPMELPMLLDDLVESGAATPELPAPTFDDSLRSEPAAESFWTEAAPRAVRRAYAAGDSESGWRAWQRFLRKRRDRASFA